MKGRMRPRRSLWLGLVIVAAAAAAAAVAIAAQGPADLTFTPQSERQMQNIDVGRAWAKNYYGAPTAVTGSGATATWDAPLNQTSNYANEARDVASKGEHWLKSHRKVANRAIVLDVDDTTLTTWNYELYSNWDFNPTTNAQFVGLTGSTFTGNAFPATPGMIDLVNQAKGYGYAIFFLTGRGDSQHQATIANLQNETAAGLVPVDNVTISGKTIPEVDANYQAPTPLNSGHGLPGQPPFADGLFTKPAIGSYPAYLNQPQFCGPAITAGTSCATIQYKSGTRAYIESQGYDIVANFGDQFSDLLNGFADKTFKMPNPNYYLP